MKLLKLQSEQELSESVFTNNINVGYSLPENAQIALKNVSIEFENPSFTVYESGINKNNTFETATDIAGPIHEINLTGGTYTLNQFLEEIQGKMNNALWGFNQDYQDFGFMWNVGTQPAGSDVKLLLAFNRADEITLTTGNSTYYNIGYNSGGSYFYKNFADNGNYNAALTANSFVNSGGLNIKTTLIGQAGITTPNIAACDWTFALTNDKATYYAEELDDIVTFSFAVISNNNGNYCFKKDGELVEPLTSIPIAVNDTIGITKKDGKILYTITKGTTTTDFEGDNINEVMPLLGASNLSYALHIGDANGGSIAFTQLKMTPNPYSSSSNGVYSLAPAESTKSVYLDTSLQVVSASRVSLYFNSKKTRELLGFLLQAYNKSLLSGSFVGDAGLALSVIGADDLEIEIVEFGNINSYSQASKQLKGIVGIIPKASLKSLVSSGLENMILSYDETASWAWLSLDNKDVFRTPSLTVRVTSNNKTLKINGNMSVCLLIKKESEAN